ncbi:MAG: extracellular solute-binding protein [Anaerolineaceae bacterium]|nr:extracellular solute-binding protein [Anaerolineaceae bacterium]
MRSKLKELPPVAKPLLIIFVILLPLVGTFLVLNEQIPPVGSCIPQSGSEALAVDPLRSENRANSLYTNTIGLPERNNSPSVIEIQADSFGMPLAQDETANQYAKASVRLQAGNTVQFDARIPAAGEFTLAFDLAVLADSTVPEGQLRVDNEFPVSGLQRFTLPVYYRNSSNIFPKDRYGNDALISQVRAVRWANVPLRDVNFSEPYPTQVGLSAGEHHFSFTLNRGEINLGSIYLISFSPYPDYAQYLASQTAADSTDFSLTLEAELPSYKNDTSVRPTSDRNLTVTPYNTYCQLLNTLGGDSWIKSGSAAYYQFEVPQDGLYEITLRAMQNTRSNFTVFRRVTINGEVPFAEFNAIPFASSSNWMDVHLGGETPYRVFLHEGVNVLGIEATNSPYLHSIETIQKALLDINSLALEIKRLTGNQRDPFKEWVISDYIPDIQERLYTIAQNLIDDKNTLSSIDERNTSSETQTYQIAIDNLLFLADNPNDIPVYMSRFSEGTGSAAQQLGTLLPLLQQQPLAVDKIIIHSPDRVPETPAIPFTTAIGEDIKRFIYSFQPDPYQSIGANDDELEVWVNRPRQYVNLLQWMTDSSFTPQTGIRVKFSIMPDESKLILANAAGLQPDVALGVATDRPYELAVRNALYDLRSFPDFDSFIHIYAPGALLGYIINDSVYALPETQDCWVTFYRKDILDSLGIPVPHTWDEVLEILPELQRYGMNFNTPLSGVAGQKNYIFTSPYLFNHGAQLYSDGGFATGLESEDAIAAIKFMADSFTIYGMPLTTANFYQDFRYGTLPIGTSNVIDTYVKLVTIAPEIGGLWNIAPFPATVLPDGTHNRYATGSAQTSIMFQNTDKPQEGWEFLKWWMSTDTQSEFAEQLVLNYGLTYLWFSANLEVLDRMDIPEEHKAVIREQWQWLQEPVRLPGSYMQERELSNIWNRIVFNGANPRVAIDRSVILINREITRKMEEFGYLQDGERVGEIKIPTIETVEAWMEHGNE